MNPNTEYGLLYYDVPSSAPNTYQAIKNLVNKTCLPVNLSVYIFDWGMRPTIEEGIKACHADTIANISMVKFDKMSTEQLEKLATKQLFLIFERITARFHKMHASLERDSVKKSCYKQLLYRVAGYEVLTTLYSCTKDVLPTLTGLKGSINAEYKTLSEEV